MVRKRRPFKRNPSKRDILPLEEDSKVVVSSEEEVRPFTATEGERSRSPEGKPGHGRTAFSYITENISRDVKSIYAKYRNMTERPLFFDDRFESQRALWFAPSAESAINLKTNFLDILAIQLWFAWNNALMSNKQDSLKYAEEYEADLMTIALYFSVPAVIYRFKTWKLASKGLTEEDLFDKVQTWIAHKSGEKQILQTPSGQNVEVRMGRNALDAYSPYRKGKQAIAKATEDGADDAETQEEELAIKSSGVSENSFKAHISRYVHGAVRTLNKQWERAKLPARSEEGHRTNRGEVSFDSVISEGGSEGEPALFSETVSGSDTYLIPYEKRSIELIEDILKTLMRLIDPVELYTTRPDGGVSLRDWVFYRLWNAELFEGCYTKREVGLLYRWGTRPWTNTELRDNRLLKGTARKDMYYADENLAIKSLTAAHWKETTVYICSVCKKPFPTNIQHCMNGRMIETQSELTYQDKFRLWVPKYWSMTMLEDILTRVRLRLQKQIYADGLVEKPRFHSFEKHRKEVGLVGDGKDEEADA